MEKKTLKYLLIFLLVLLSYGFIVYKIINFNEITESSFSIINYSFSNLLLLLLVIILMILNWSFETIKWRILINTIQKLSYTNSFKAVFTGISIGIFTPNRIGEIGGRVLFLEKGKRTYGILATGIGSFAQFITTISMGIIGFNLFLIKYPLNIELNTIFNRISAIILFAILIILLWSYFNTKRIIPILIKIPFFKRRLNQLEFLSETKTSSLIKILIYSNIRYFIFISQYYLLLFLFDIYLKPTQAFISISLIYLFATLIPTTTLAELGIRGSLSIFFVGIFSQNIPGIVFSTAILWFINLGIPSIIGSVFFIKNKLSPIN